MLETVLHFLERRVVSPVTDLLRVGATPRRLAWSFAIGIVIGVNPLLGSTTLVALAAAAIFRLNLVASQLGNHVMYPLELAFFPLFIKAGSRLFGTPGLPLRRHELLNAVKHHPWDTTRALWMWEWHALVVWAAAATAVVPLLALTLRPALEKMLDKLHHEPIVEK
jgi:uncharacterized protein (DUF2062 family)